MFTKELFYFARLNDEYSNVDLKFSERTKSVLPTAGGVYIEEKTKEVKSTQRGVLVIQ